MIDLRPVRAFLEPHHLEMATELDAYLERTIAPMPEPADDDEARTQAREVLDLLGGGGWYAPIERQDLRGLCVVREAVAARSPLADAVVALQALAGTPLLLADNEGAREAWLEPTLRGAAMGAFAMTEPGAGSDVAAMSARAVPDGDGYRIDGGKWLISNAGIADYYVVFAVTDPAAGTRGLSCFAVGAATDGLRYVGPQVMASPHPLGEIAFESCRVPASARLGAEGEGFKLGMKTLDRLRPTVAAAACGMATRALEEALAHARERTQFG